MIYIALAVIIVISLAIILKTSKEIDGTGEGGWHILGPTVNEKNVQQGVTLDLSEGEWTVEFGPSGFMHAVINKGNGVPPVPIVLEVDGDFTKLNGSPANVGIYVQRKGDNWSGKGEYEFYRCYSPTKPLIDGTIVLDFPLTNWHGIHGKYNEVEFQKTLRNIDNYGIRIGPHGAKGGTRIQQKLRR